MAKKYLCLGISIVLTGLAFVVRSKWDITEMTIVMTPLFIYIFIAFNAVVDYVLLVVVSLIVSIVIDKIWNYVDKFYKTLKS